jgi:hypothetical protein
MVVIGGLSGGVSVSVRLVPPELSAKAILWAFPSASAPFHSPTRNFKGTQACIGSIGGLCGERDEEQDESHEKHEEFHAACKPSIKQEDAEHKSVKHVSKVEIKTFSAAVAERDSRNGRVNQKCTYTDLE